MIRVLAVVGMAALTVGFVTPRGQAQAPRKSVMVVDFVDRAGTWSGTRMP